MPRIIGVRELKNHTSRVIRAVREEMSEYVVTLRGEPVAVLRPLTEEETQRLRRGETEAALADLLSEPLITLDRQQLERGAAVVTVQRP